MRKVIFLSMDDLEGWVSDDELLTAPLRAAGWEVESISWHAAGVDWASFDAVVIRTTWDYQQSPAEFLEVLRRIERSGTPLANSVEQVAWNYDKRYLFELEQKGVRIVPSRLVEPPVLPEALESARALHGGGGIVIKPTVGATASDTFRVAADEKIPNEVYQTFAAKPCLVQPFIPSVVTEGEYSLHFFGGELSHTIVKVPAAGDYRVQEEWGGIPSAVKPEFGLEQAARYAFSHLPGETLYARIDMVRLPDGSFGLMEAEIIEPALYLRTDPLAPGRFVRAFLNWVETQQ